MSREAQLTILWTYDDLDSRLSSLPGGFDQWAEFTVPRTAISGQIPICHTEAKIEMPGRLSIEWLVTLADDVMKYLRPLDKLSYSELTSAQYECFPIAKSFIRDIITVLDKIILVKKLIADKYLPRATGYIRIFEDELKKAGGEEALLELELPPDNEGKDSEALTVEEALNNLDVLRSKIATWQTPDDWFSARFKTDRIVYNIEVDREAPDYWAYEIQKLARIYTRRAKSLGG